MDIPSAMLTVSKKATESLPAPIHGRDNHLRHIDSLLLALKKALVGIASDRPTSDSGLDSIETLLIDLERSASLAHQARSINPFGDELNSQLQELSSNAAKAIQIVHSVRSGDADQQSLRAAIDGLQPTVPFLSKSIRFLPVKNRLLSFDFWRMTFVLGVGAVTMLLYWRSGLVPSSRSVIHPRGPFRTADSPAVLSAIPVERREYLKTFSEQFFRGKRDYKDNFYRYLEKGATKAPARVVTERTQLGARGQSTLVPLQRWRSELINCSYLHSEFLSDVKVQLRLAQPSEFPWNELRTRPHLEYQFVAEEKAMPTWASIVAKEESEPKIRKTLTISNCGLGPAVDVDCTLVTDDGTKLLERTFSIIHDHRETIDFTDYFIGGENEAATSRVTMNKQDFTISYDEFDEAGARKEITTSPVDQPDLIDGYPVLSTPLFLELAESTPPSAAEIVEHEGRRYEVIRHMARLREVTAVAWNESAIFEICYSGLEGTIRRKRILFDLPPWLIYYIPKPTLLWYDPREGRPQVPESYQAGKTVPEQWSVTPPHVEPVGDDVIRIECAFDGRQLARQETIQTIGNVAWFLKPRGRLVVDVDFSYPRSGIYEVSVIVNGDSVDRYLVDVLAPDELYFDPTNSKQVARLKEYWSDTDE